MRYSLSCRGYICFGKEQAAQPDLYVIQVTHARDAIELSKTKRKICDPS